MESKKNVMGPLAALIFVGIVAFVAATPLSAQVVIPGGSTIDNATLTVFALDADGQTVDVHRITADWGETSVTWAGFAGAYDNAVVGSYNGSFGQNSTDVAALVQAWVDGVVPNFGFLLRQNNTDYIEYYSSETGPAYVYERPKLRICYTSPAGMSDCVVIQRPGAAQEGVADTYIWESAPNANNGTSARLWTGLYNGFEKQCLVRFNFTVESEPPGTGTPGYWKNHPDAWPTETINIGGVTFDKPDAIIEMKRPTRKDMTRVMFRALVAAKLNVMIGNDGSCISEFIQAADIWMLDHPLGTGVRGRDAAWDEGEPIKDMLNHYNNGRLPCADHRD